MDQAGEFSPAFASEDVPVILTHFVGVADPGTAIDPLTYLLTEGNEASITLTNNGIVTITEDIVLQWNDLYKFYLEVA